MPRSYQLFVDLIGQILLLAAFIYLLSISSSHYFFDNWRFFVLFSILWQTMHALISTRVYEHPLRQSFLRALLWSLLWIVLPVGLLYFVVVIFFSLSINWEAALWVFRILDAVRLLAIWALPAAFTGLIGWYYYLTAKDIYILTNKTI